jgi:hypothetical protein
VGSKDTWTCSGCGLEYPHDHTGHICPPTILDEAKRFLDGRVALGKATYGMTLDENDADIDAWLLHLQEELGDALQYVIKARRKLKEGNRG